jgi:hypothetical protein
MSAELAVLEALSDPRLGSPSQEEIAAELAVYFPGATVSAPAAADLDESRRGRALEWAMQTLTQGEVLDAFAGYCRDELDDVDVLEQEPSRLALAWRRERSSVELRAGLLFSERLAAEGPALLLAQLDDPVVERFLADAGLRSRIAVFDLARLEKINAVRASVFVYFEWFLRDTYGVKLLPSSSFTQGLVERGIISLGMG